MQDFEDEVTRGKKEIDQLKVSLKIEQEKSQNLENKSLSEKSRRRKVKHISKNRMKNLILLIFQNIQRMTKLANQCNQLKANLQMEKQSGRDLAEKSEENSRLQKVQWFE